MSIPMLRAVGRLTLASLASALLFIALDTVVLEAGTRAIAWWQKPRASAEFDAQAQRLREQAAAHPTAAVPELRRAAWRLGHAFGVASQAAHWAAIGGQPKMAELADGVLRDVDDDARRFGLAPLVPLRGRSFAEAAALTQRIENDEAGLAARIEAASTPLHRHLFLAGAHAGLEWVLRVTPNAPEGHFGGPHIARHAQLAGLAPGLWQPLADPPGGDSAARRAAFLAAMAAVDAHLAQQAPPATGAR